MSKKIGSARIAPSVNPQGHGKDVEFSTEPKSELENKQKGPIQNKRNN
ncbi:small, acid-soluble spore protein L [Peribacillus sp. NJ11]|nr:small, acid-soluble spore protein L [Peribacillus sp. NJ11]MDM5221300.1 small, acid-soluble spore protein L [Peribacillus sp. NJ11]